MKGRPLEAGLHKRMTGRDDSGREEARKTGETARVGAGASRRFTLARARGGAPELSSVGILSKSAQVRTRRE